MSLISEAVPQAGSAPRPRMAASRTRLESLTGLRWFAALLIFCYHFSYEQYGAGTAKHLRALKDATFAGPSAVSFFFILSGFVLAWSARLGDPVPGFWRRRFARIYPSHLVTFGIAALMLVWMGKRLETGLALSNLTLTQSWVPNDEDRWFAYNGVSWSLGCEFFFYLCFPLLISAMRRLPLAGLWAVVGLGNLFVLLHPFTTGFFLRTAGWEEKFTLYMFPPVRLAEFVIGIALALLVKKGAWRGPGLVASVALSVGAVLALAHLMPEKFHWVAVTVVPFTLTVAAAARADVRGEESPFRNRFVVYLGEVSFAFYLLHEMVIFSTSHFLRLHHVTVPLAVHAALVMAISLGGAVLLHEYVEKPCVKWLGPRAERIRRSGR
ncbi:MULTISPECIES: acyltransferase family protein [Streptomyces]|uniref:Acyltransferase family protein n=1 Tax=Streptomyces ehimensis TaxID=68195 RepID=A0ABV9BGY9_9ACTN